MTRASLIAAAVAVGLFTSGCGGGTAATRDAGSAGAGGAAADGGLAGSGGGRAGSDAGGGSGGGGTGGGGGGTAGTGGGGSGGKNTTGMCRDGLSCAAGQSCGFDCMGNTGSVNGLTGPAITCACSNGAYSCRVVWEGTAGSVPPACPAGSACSPRCNLCQSPADGTTKMRTCFCSADLVWICA